MELIVKTKIQENFPQMKENLNLYIDGNHTCLGSWFTVIDF